jgi:hypothetical protein
MPVPLEITLKNGTKVKKMLPADIWRTSDVYNYVLETKDEAVEVILDPDNWLPDVNKTDNRWTQKND